jgi:hypothetical protein
LRGIFGAPGAWRTALISRLASGSPWDDGGALFAALEHVLARIEPEPAFFVVRVTTEADVDEQGPDLRFEQLGVGCLWRRVNNAS